MSHKGFPVAAPGCTINTANEERQSCGGSEARALTRALGTAQPPAAPNPGGGQQPQLGWVYLSSPQPLKQSRKLHAQGELEARGGGRGGAEVGGMRSFNSNREHNLHQDRGSRAAQEKKPTFSPAHVFPALRSHYSYFSSIQHRRAL